VKEHRQSANAALASVRERLASAPYAEPAHVLGGVVEALSRGRGYAWTGIYVAIENQGICQASSGPAPAGVTIDDLQAEIVVPIKRGARTLGLLVAETGNRVGVASPERALLQRVTKLIARYFAANRAKQVLRAAHEKIHPEPEHVRKSKSPQSARPALRKAAAGEQFPR
jgi:GAF domain-containing protein